MPTAGTRASVPRRVPGQAGDEQVQAWQLAPSLLFSGIGLGLAMAPFFDIALAGVSDEEAGSAGGVLNAAQQLGGCMGVAVLGTVFFGRVGHGMGGAAQLTLLIAAAALAVAVPVAFLMPRRAAHPEPEESALRAAA